MIAAFYRWRRGHTIVSPLSAHGVAGVHLEAISVDKNSIGFAGQEEVEVNDADKETASDDVSEGGGDHGFPDVVPDCDVFGSV